MNGIKLREAGSDYFTSPVNQIFKPYVGFLPTEKYPTQSRKAESQRRVLKIGSVVP